MLYLIQIQFISVHSLWPSVCPERSAPISHSNSHRRKALSMPVLQPTFQVKHFAVTNLTNLTWTNLNVNLICPEKSPIHVSSATNISGKTFCCGNLTQFNLSGIKPYYLCQYRNQYFSKQFQISFVSTAFYKF